MTVVVVVVVKCGNWEVAALKDKKEEDREDKALEAGAHLTCMPRKNYQLYIRNEKKPP